MKRTLNRLDKAMLETASDMRKAEIMDEAEFQRIIQRTAKSCAVKATVKKKSNHWVSSCPDLDVVSQGKTKEEAIANLEEAIRMFLASCHERGTLEEVLGE